MNDTLYSVMGNPTFVTILVIWSLFWKGIALWKAARKEHVSWFIILLFVNTFGLLDIAYIFYLNKYFFGSKKLMGLIRGKLSKKVEYKY